MESCHVGTEETVRFCWQSMSCYTRHSASVGLWLGGDTAIPRMGGCDTSLCLIVMTLQHQQLWWRYALYRWSSILVLYLLPHSYNCKCVFLRYKMPKYCLCVHFC